MAGTTRKIALGSYIPLDLADRLDAHLAKTGETKTAFVEQAIEAWLARSRAGTATLKDRNLTLVVPPGVDEEHVRIVAQNLCQPGAVEMINGALRLMAKEAGRKAGCDDERRPIAAVD